MGKAQVVRCSATNMHVMWKALVVALIRRGARVACRCVLVVFAIAV